MSRTELLRQLADLVDAGVPCASAQIVKATGSIPNELGAMMLVGAGGAFLGGTIGGGPIEAQVLRAAGQALAEGKSRLVSSKLTAVEAGGVGMMCGGSVEVFVEVHVAAPKLILLGAGHINLNLARIARGLDLHVVVIDERPEWANADNYPNAQLIVERPELGLAQVEVTERSFIVVGTPGHDHLALVAAAKTPARYIGLVASKRKTIEVVGKVGAELPLDTLLPRLFAPVGLRLGGRTPEAIALSILSEIQALRHDLPAPSSRIPPEQLQCYIDETAPPS